jgi:tRNA modification GTPase
MEDTIVGISTALGIGAVSIIRLSGSEAINIVNSIFKGKDLSKIKTHTITYGHIIDNDKIIDEILVSVMHSPATYTKEDVVEINCHGGIATTQKILELLLIKGCRLSEPGEFTKRAFLNGRIDLVEAEGVMDLINAKTDQARSVAINQVGGKVTNLIKDIRQYLIEILANIEVNIDYPEYEDIEQINNEILIPKIDIIKEKIKKIIKESENGKLIKEGIKTVIIGRPNVGKSSLLNKLIEEDKAIVTDVAGTTRDIVEGTLNLDGILLNIIDTAGIRDTNDKVEKIGVDKSLQLIDKADLILFMLNNNEQINKDDINILEKTKKKNTIIIINKIDLKNKLDVSKISNKDIIYMSIENDQGLDSLKTKINDLFKLEKIKQNDLTYLTNARSIAILKNVLESIKDVEKGINNKMPIDMIEIDIKQIWSNLGEIIGETYKEELIDQLFSQFCLGK